MARSAGLALAVYGAGALAPNALEAGIESAQAAGTDRVLISIFCAGGLDSLSLLAPVGDSRYRTLRPSLGLPTDAAFAFAEDSRLQWHPNVAAFRDLHAAGKLTVIPAIGYDDANQSHFTSRHYWEVGELNPAGRIGWLGRYLDKSGSSDNPLQGLSLDWTLAPSLATGSVPVAAVAQPDQYSLYARDIWDDGLFEAGVARWGAMGRMPTSDSELALARKAAFQSVSLRTQLSGLQGHEGEWQNAVTYPEGYFPDRLSALAEMIDRGLPMRVRGDGRQRRLRHAREPGGVAERRPRRAVALAGRLPGGPRGPRHRRPRARRTCGASSGGARRRTARAPTTARAAPRC